MPYLFNPDTPDGRATEFLKARMGMDAFDALVQRDYVDVPIPDGYYDFHLPSGHHILQNAAVRVTAGGTISVVQQGTNTLLVRLCVYAGDWPRDDMNFVQSIPLADRVFTFWFLARVDPHALLRAANA